MKLSFPAFAAAVTILAHPLALAGMSSAGSSHVSLSEASGTGKASLVYESATLSVFSLDSFIAASQSASLVESGEWGQRENSASSSVSMVESWDFAMADGYLATSMTVNYSYSFDTPDGVGEANAAFQLNASWDFRRGQAQCETRYCPTGSAGSLFMDAYQPTNLLSLDLDGTLTTNATAFATLGENGWVVEDAVRANARLTELTVYISKQAIASPVPEPGTWLMLGAGLAVVAGVARRQRGKRPGAR